LYQNYYTKMIVENDKDDLEWLDNLNYEAKDYFDQPSYRNYPDSDWTFVIWFESKKRWNPCWHRSNHKTFVVYDRKGCFNKIESFQKLFELATECGIKRLIFTKCLFNFELKLDFPSTFQEVVFSDCFAIRRVLSGMRCCNKITFREDTLNNLSLEALYHFTFDEYYLRQIRLINCKIESGFEFYNSNKHRDTLGKYRILIEKFQLLLKRNELGYRKCKDVCEAFYTVKTLKLSPLLVNIDINVIIEFVELIWKSRYQKEWYT